MDRQTDSNQRYWRANWQREIEGAYLYRQLARFARTPDMQKMMAEMADQEKTHAAVWAEHIQSADPKARPPRPDLRVYLIAGLARWLGAEAVLGLLINDEVSDIATYADQANRLGDEVTYRRVLSDETSHARALAALRSPEAPETAEPWHRSASAGGLLRVVVYGFNDGLTANFGLVMGVIGHPHYTFLFSAKGRSHLGRGYNQYGRPLPGRCQPCHLYRTSGHPERV